MAYINDVDFDVMLASMKTASESLHICSSEPATYGDIATYSLGEKVGPSIADPSDKAGGGRECIVAAITDGACDGNGTANFWALVKTSATARLVATGAITTPQAVISGNPFTLTSFAYGVSDAT